VVQLDSVFDDPAQFIEYRLFVFAVTASVDQAWRAADIAVVLIGPLDDSLRIARYLSFLRLLDCQLNGAHLVVLRVIAQRSPILSPAVALSGERSFDGYPCPLDLQSQQLADLLSVLGSLTARLRVAQ